MGEAAAVHSFWFHSRPVGDAFRTLWFPGASGVPGAEAAADAEVTQRFGGLLARGAAGELEGWKAQPRSCVALIVLLDQFSRHVYRQQGEAGSSAQAAADAAALAATEHLLASGWAAQLSVPEHVFSLMPLRHSQQLASLQRALREAEGREVTEATHVALLARFRKATLRRVQDAEGRQWLPGDELLEHAAFVADESGLLAAPLTRTVASFLEAHAPEVAAAPRWDGPDPPPVRVCVSLSGGVDSMVLALALARLGAGRWSVAGCHIDYGNRPESSAEAAFVQAWCEGQDIAFRLCTLPERLRRGLAGQGREAYEKESRDVRYNFYARSLAELGCAGMAVGHHRGDVQENVLTNLLKGASLLTVAGMSEVSRVNGVPVWRPLLPWDKAAIFAFAHRYGVPYFRDTTPTWSTRGKLRRQVLPLLCDVFGDGIMHNLSSVGSDAEQLAAMVRGALLEPFWSSAVASAAGVWFDAAPWLSQPHLFWKEGLKQLCHGLGTGLVKEKAITELLYNLRRSRTRGTWVPIKRDNRAYIDGSRVAIFAGPLFPAVAHFQPGVPLLLGCPAAFGPWTVTCDIVPAEDPATGAPRLAAPPVTMWDVLSGAFAYHLPLTAEDEAACWPPAASWTGLRTAAQPHMPPVLHMAPELRAVLPLVVTGTGDGDAPPSELSEPGAAPTFSVRRWSRDDIAAPRCVRVSMRYERPQRSEDTDEKHV